MIEERLRIRESDVLEEMHQELCQRGLWLSLADGDAREQWFLECRELLAAVSDPAQRRAWQMLLAMAILTKNPGLPGDMLMAKLEVSNG